MHHCAFSTDDNLFTKAIFAFFKLVASYVFFILDGINFYQGHIFAFSKRLLWLVGNLQLRLVKPLHAHHGHVPGDDEVEVQTSYLSFFLHEKKFWRIKFTPKKRINYDKIHSKLPFFCVITAKYTVNCQFFALNL